MKKQIILIITFFCFFTFGNAEVVKKIDITGNKRVSSETIKIYGEIEINKNYSEKDINLILQNLYETEFFEDVKINLENNILKISLKEYPIVNQLIIIGEASKKYKDEIKKVIRLKEKNL